MQSHQDYMNINMNEASFFAFPEPFALPPSAVPLPSLPSLPMPPSPSLPSRSVGVGHPHPLAGAGLASSLGFPSTPSMLPLSLSMPMSMTMSSLSMDVSGDLMMQQHQQQQMQQEQHIQMQRFPMHIQIQPHHEHEHEQEQQPAHTIKQEQEHEHDSIDDDRLTAPPSPPSSPSSAGSDQDDQDFSAAPSPNGSTLSLVSLGGCTLDDAAMTPLPAAQGQGRSLAEIGRSRSHRKRALADEASAPAQGQAQGQASQASQLQSLPAKRNHTKRQRVAPALPQPAKAKSKSKKKSKPQLQVGPDGELFDPEQLRRDKLRRKAELARACRNRKKETMAMLEAEVKRLQGEIAQERAKNASLVGMTMSAMSSSISSTLAAEYAQSVPSVPSVSAPQLKTSASMMSLSSVTDSVSSGPASPTSPSSPRSASPSPQSSPLSAPASAPAPAPAPAKAEPQAQAQAQAKAEVVLSCPCSYDGDAHMRLVQQSMAQIAAVASATLSVKTEPNTDSKEGSEQQQRDAHINALVDSFTHIAAGQAKGVEAHLSALDKMLQPCLPITFLEWVMNQNDKFYADPAGLWQSLFRKEVGLNDEQMESLAALRRNMQAQRVREGELRLASMGMGVSGMASSLAPEALCAMQSLWTNMPLQSCFRVFASIARLKNEHAQANLAALHRIMQPAQLARFFSWTAKYGEVCIQINP